MSDRAICFVFRFGNGLVAVFDADGEQIPEHQGLYLEHERELFDLCGPAVQFHLANSNRGVRNSRRVSREEFFAN